MSEENNQSDLVKRALEIFSRPIPKRGITVADVLTVFPGAKVYPIPKRETPKEPEACEHCQKESVGNKVTLINTYFRDGVLSHRSVRKERLETPVWRRNGKMILRQWPDGRKELACSFCGRAKKEDK
jgi:hypothetical protein